MEIKRIDADVKLAFPIRWSTVETQKAEKDVARYDQVVAKKDGVVTVLEPLVWAFHSPLPRTVFEANYRIVSAAHMAIWSRGAVYAAASGPVVATLALKDAARADMAENGLEDDPSKAILTEIGRLTSVLSPAAQGFETLPPPVAVARGVIDAEDWREAESAIVFFTLGWSMARREERKKVLRGLAWALLGLTTSSNATEFAASLATSTKAATSAPPATASSIPS